MVSVDDIAVYINIGLRSIDYINMMISAMRSVFFSRHRHPPPSAVLLKNASVTKVCIHLPHILTIFLSLIFIFPAALSFRSSRMQIYFIIRFLFKFMI